METLERTLGQHPFFEGLSPDYLKLVVGCASNARFETGAYLFRQGGEANQFFLLRQGRVALEIYQPQCPPITVETVEKDDVVGWSWLVAPYIWSCDGRAVELTRALVMDGKCLRAKCEENHDLGYELLKRFVRIMEQRLSSTRVQLLDVYAPHR